MNIGISRSHLDVSQYLALQKRLFDLFPYVSCQESNFSTFSSELCSILLDAGSFFDSLSQTFIRTYSQSGLTFLKETEVKYFSKKVSNEKYFSMGDYRILLENQFELSKKLLNLNVYGDDFSSYPISFIRNEIHRFGISPFGEWANDYTLEWWDAFTNLKHDRNCHISEATLGNCIYATGAVFIVLTVFHEDYIKHGCHGIDTIRLFSPTYWKVKGSKTQIQPNYE